jgi:hypothetical protein
MYCALANGEWVWIFCDLKVEKKRGKKGRERERRQDSPLSVMQNQDEVEFGLLST